MTNRDNYIGKQIGNYRVTSELARGAFGRVYLAQHTYLKRIVAIKLLQTTLFNSPEERENFLREAQILEQLEHPYILPIFDVGIENDIPYLVAEYAPNGSLRDLLKRRAPHLLSSQEILTIFQQIGQALQYAHQKQIIHRDIKPENILFNANNEALLADFGLATSLATASIKHVDNSGTPRYMAPEQFQGNVSKESDIYALGCIAFELVTGRPLFTDTDFFAIGFKHISEQPTSPTLLNPHLPPAIEQVILKALAKQRTDRYHDAATFIAALQYAASAQAYGHAPSHNVQPLLPASEAGNTTDKFQAPSRRPTDRNTSVSHKPGQHDTEPVTDSKKWVTDATVSGVTADKRGPRESAQNPSTPIPAFTEAVAPFIQGSPGQSPTLPLARNPITPSPIIDVPLSPFEQETRLPLRSGAGGPPPLFDLFPSRARRPSKGGWLLLMVAGLVVIASFLGILLFTMPGLLPHNPGPLALPAATVGSATSGTTLTSARHTTPGVKPTGKLTHKPTSKSTAQPTPGKTAQPTPGSTQRVATQQPTSNPTVGVTPTSPQSSPTPTPTFTPTPSPSPTPSPTPAPVSETITVPFVNGNAGVQTTNSYTGTVTVDVNGTGVASQQQQSDAFYLFTDNNGSLITPVHKSCWVMYINNSPTENFINPIPSYDPSHSYHFTMTAPGGTLNFAICDGVTSDDSGNLSLTITQNSSSSAAIEERVVTLMPFYRRDTEQ